MKRMKQCKALPQTVSAFAFLLTVAGMNAVNRVPFMDASWDGFKNSMTRARKPLFWLLASIKEFSPDERTTVLQSLGEVRLESLFNLPRSIPWLKQ